MVTALITWLVLVIIVCLLYWVILQFAPPPIPRIVLVVCVVIIVIALIYLVLLPLVHVSPALR